MYSGKGQLKSHEYHARSLFQVLKDYNNRKLIDKQMRFFYEAVRTEARKKNGLELLEDPGVFIPSEDMEPLVRLYLAKAIPGNTHSDVMRAVKNIRFTKMELHIDDCHDEERKNTMISLFDLKSLPVFLLI